MKDSIIVTSTGRKIDPLNPDPRFICIEDIARGLSRLCRFTGQLKPEREFYSVAQHSVLATKWAMALRFATGIGYQTMIKKHFSILLHDASEAYLNDISSPVKSELPDYRAIESVLQGVIFRKFTGSAVWEDVYHTYDKYAYWLEIQHIMPQSSKLDEYATIVPDCVPKIANLIIRQTWSPYRAYDEFMYLCGNLMANISL